MNSKLDINSIISSQIKSYEQIPMDAVVEMMSDNHVYTYTFRKIHSQYHMEYQVCDIDDSNPNEKSSLYFADSDAVIEYMRIFFPHMLIGKIVNISIGPSANAYYVSEDISTTSKFITKTILGCCIDVILLLGNVFE